MDKESIVSDYFENEGYRKSFNQLAKETFGLDFETWYKDDAYKGKYISYAYIINEQVVANISINKMHLIVKGKPINAIQIGTVMTHPDYRRRGLSGKLMHHVLAQYEEYDLIYLFANDTVLDFYPKFGFSRVEEMAYYLKASQVEKRRGSIRLLNLENEKDRILIETKVRNRVPISKILGVYEDEWPLGVYCKNEYSKHLYYIENQSCIVIAERIEGMLHLYDVLSEEPIQLDKLIEHMVQANDEEIEFHFVPDLSKYKVVKKLCHREDDTLFVKGAGLADLEVIFPMTSHT
ncbi:MAG: GNAT family N-acetyltransferase [Candidatus Niameybacter stercoravium]|nr:GNAT family N-acetyltransferase [Candidatus Niameybacter stercoravium]